jgi:RHS repeat-associated protein
LSFTYDALSRKLTEAGPLGTVSSAWNLDGTRTALTGPNYALNFTSLVTGETNTILDGLNGLLAAFTYDDLGRRTGIARPNGTSTSYSYDPISRLTSLTQDLAGTANDLTIGSIAYNPASQIVALTRSNDAYAFTQIGRGSTAYGSNNLNQLTSVGGANTAHDARGNLTSDPTTGNSYAYSSENRLTSATVGGNAVTLSYDPLGRLYQVSGASGTRRFAYDGLDPIVETDGAGAFAAANVFGPGSEPMVWYDNAGNRRFLHGDERGSVVAISDAAGNPFAIDSYDEYGRPGASNQGRFQYTGQMWIPEIGLYYYRARMYAPALGRFLQTDPVGYDAGTNLYAYVGNDPVNSTDPLGLCNVEPCSGDITINGSTIEDPVIGASRGFNTGGAVGGGAPGVSGGSGGGEIIVSAPRLTPPNGTSDNDPGVVTPPVSEPPRVFAAAARQKKKQDFCGNSTLDVPEGSWANACRIHDECYGTPGANKQLCDVNLFDNMLKECLASTMFTAMPLCAVVPIIYWFGVTIGGNGSYRRGQHVE